MIEVMAIRTEADGKQHIYWGGETGTTEFYTVTFTLRAYLGENVLIYHHHENDTFVIEDKDADEGYDNSYDYIEIIESIYDNAEVYKQRAHISFEIINVE
jgi:hypothetical protein